VGACGESLGEMATEIRVGGVRDKRTGRKIGHGIGSPLNVGQGQWPQVGGLSHERQAAQEVG
jgi:hypothetical protein